MRFLVMVKSAREVRPGDKPPEAMKAFNREMMRDGVIVDFGGLHHTEKGARIDYSGPRPVVTDGPFTEAKEVIAGFWILQARSKEELVERLSRCPFEGGESIEIRQVFEPAEFAEN